jgi:hypothetical protein
MDVSLAGDPVIDTDSRDVSAVKWVRGRYGNVHHHGYNGAHETQV